MSELRHEPIYDRYVLIAPDRLRRPNALMATGPIDRVPDANRCPFCRGHESETPAAVLTLPAESTGPWQVRVVPNRYPAVSPTAVGSEAVAGVHEVVIESASHLHSFLELSIGQRCLVLQAYRHRLQHLRSLPGIGWGLIFKNQGAEAGASQPHLHSQVLGMANPSPASARSAEYAQQYWLQHEQCVFCQRVNDIRQSGMLLVSETDDFVAFCPAASRFAYETWVMPRRHACSFELSDDHILGRASDFLAEILARMENSIENVAYNFAIQTAPFDTASHDHYHWHIVIYPRLARLAGCELFADIFINPVDPETAAERLRQAADTK